MPGDEAPSDGHSSARHFADRLIERGRRIGSAVCVGIDPRWGMLPEALRTRAREVESDPARAAAWAYGELAAAVIDATASFACAAKPQAAFFEALGPVGYEALARVVALARGAGLVVIADAKRGDIGSTSLAYAQAAFGGGDIDGRPLAGLDADALTVNPYF
ncbi:MAG: orotidine-5'-phosphate decarboxylase, partial [Planctomycetota bacterium]